MLNRMDRVSAPRGIRRITSFAAYSAVFALIFAAGGMDGASCTPDPNGGGGGGGGSAPQIVPTDHILGDANAPVTVVEYADFECPFCGRFARETFPAIKQQYIDTGKVRWVFRHFPLRSIHPNAEGAARATECADDQGQFWAYHDEVYENQSAGLQSAKLKEYATNVGLNRSLFDPCADGDSKAVRVQTDVNSGTALGVSSTPTFYVNKVKVVGFQTVQQMSQVIENELP